MSKERDERQPALRGLTGAECLQNR